MGPNGGVLTFDTDARKRHVSQHERELDHTVSRRREASLRQKHYQQKNKRQNCHDQKLGMECLPVEKQPNDNTSDMSKRTRLKKPVKRENIFGHATDK